MYKYPLAVLSDQDTLIRTKLFVFDITDNEFKNIMSCLIEFEGPIYSYSIVKFYDQSGEEEWGIIFSVKSEIKIHGYKNMHVLSLTHGIYSW